MIPFLSSTLLDLVEEREDVLKASVSRSETNKGAGPERFLAIPKQRRPELPDSRLSHLNFVFRRTR